MYWNLIPFVRSSRRLLININMRCIEIEQWCRRIRQRWRLTLTWDVLKYVRRLSIRFLLLQININMRCIEMWLCWSITELWRQININMRCIEIFISIFDWSCAHWLTLTWDVLKFERIIEWMDEYYWLTLTWDVLKCRQIDSIRCLYTD